MFRCNIISFIVPILSIMLICCINITFKNLLEVDKCPLCYGTSFCQEFLNENIVYMNSPTLLKIIIFFANFIGLNNVIFASVNSTSIVIKRLAHNNEFYALDHDMHLNKHILALRNVQEIKKTIKNHLNIPFGSNTTINIRFCPSVENIDVLFESIFNENFKTDTNFYTNILFTLMLNPEPLIQQILPSKDGWPVPDYLGSCGRTVVSNYCGDTLTNYVKENWPLRCKIARHLLIAALNFTFSHPLFGFYFTDIGPDNIAISPEGKPVFIDLENVIIVEKNSRVDDGFSSWEDTHASENEDCDGCFAFSSDDICSHIISDHNVFAICREILNPKSYLIDGGLLHSIPDEFLKKYSNFTDILQECVLPTKGKDRFYYAKEMISILM